jgi:stage II sporulation protein D
MGTQRFHGGTHLARFGLTAIIGLSISLLGYYALDSVEMRAPVPKAAANVSASLPVDLPAPLLGESRLIRVALTDNPSRAVTLKVDSPFTLYAIGSNKPLFQGTALKETRVECAGQSLRIAGKTYSATRLEIVPKSSPAIWVNGHQYRGRVRVYRQPGGKLWAVNVLPLEDYIASVVDSEMPTAFPKAAREAQAICSRTYAVYQTGQARSHPYFDVFASTKSQNYLGYQYVSKGKKLAGETPEGRRIARKTAGLVCLYQGEVFCTYYSAVCGGHTTRGDLVFTDAALPLKQVPCEWCKSAPLYRWNEKQTKPAATRKLASLFGSSSKALVSINRMDNKALTPASLFAASNGQKTVSLSAVDLRRRMDLPSADFQVWEDSGHFLFQGKGHGHGVGLCQWGARGMALAGKSALEILHHYYPGAEIAPMRE